MATIKTVKMVKKLFVLLTLCLCTFATHGQKTRFTQVLPHAKPGDTYPIKLHISGVRYRNEYGGGSRYNDILYVDALMNGRKVELRVSDDILFQYYKAPLGDYQARLLKASDDANNAPIGEVYEVLLPNNTVWHGNVTGISE